MFGRIAAILIWIGCFYYDLWSIIPKNEHSTLGIALFILFIIGDDPVFTFKRTIERHIKKAEEDET